MFNRPGPRLVEGLEFLAGLLHGRHDLIPQGGAPRGRRPCALPMAGAARGGLRSHCSAEASVNSAPAGVSRPAMPSVSKHSHVLVQEMLSLPLLPTFCKPVPVRWWPLPTGFPWEWWRPAEDEGPPATAVVNGGSAVAGGVDGAGA
jgi:hypothetical protein